MTDETSTPRILENRPGLSQLDYRITDYRATRQRLLQLLPTILRSPDGTIPAPLARLTSRLTDDPTIALLDAWAVVADVLTFYQERIANEGYLRTATERRSVLELARMIGYELDPGVAASTYLAFTVEEAPGSPDVVKIPIGTQIMSVPVKDELPQIFETIEEFVAYREWNTLKPRQTRPQIISGKTNQLYLKGASLALRAGDKLLLIDDIPDIQKYLLTLTEVKPFPDAGYTLIQWQQAFPMLVEPLRNPKLFTFQQRALLFGNTAPQWETMPAEVKLAALAAKGQPIQGGVFRSLNNGEAWEAVSQGLPSEDILSLTIREGVLFAGTPTKGVFRSRDNGKTWSGTNQGLTNFRIQALYTDVEDGQGPVFAGTPGGGIFRSKDLGENWVPINFGSVRVESVPDGSDPPTNWRSINTSLPNTVVRSILAYTTTNQLGTGSISSEETLITGEGTEFTQELQIGDEITALGQTRTVTQIDSDVRLRVNSAFTNENLNPGTAYVANTINILPAPNPFIPIVLSQGTISSQGTMVTGEGTDFSRLRDGNTTMTITASGQTRTVEEVISDTSLRINSPFIRPNLDSGTSFTLATPIVRYYIFVGSDDGVYRSQNLGGDWLSLGLADRIVYSLLYDETHLFVGTDTGISRSSDHGQSWAEVNTGLPTDSKVFALNRVNNNLFAGTDQGIFRSANQGNNWEAIQQIQNANTAGLNTLSDCRVRSLATYERQGVSYLVAATDRGIFVSDNCTAANPIWEWVSQDLATQNTTAVIFNGATDEREKAIYAGSQFAGFVAEETQAAAEQATPEPQKRKIEWPDFHIPSSTEIDLDTLYPQLLERSWIALFDDRNPNDPEERTEPRVAIRQVRDLSTVFRSEFGLTSKVTRIEPDMEVEPKEFGLRSTTVLIQNELLELAREPVTVSDRQYEIFQDPILAGTVFLNQFVQGLQPNQAVIVSGKPIRAQLNTVGGVLLPRQWERWVAGLDNQEVQALLWESGILYAGTADGVYRFQANRQSWEPINVGLGNRDVRTLVMHNGSLLAGTAKGIYQLQADRLIWETLHSDIAEVRVLASLESSSLETPQDKLLLAGTSTGVYYPTNENEIAKENELTNTTINDLTGYQIATQTGQGVISSKGLAVFADAATLSNLKIGDILTVAGQSRIIIRQANNELIINEPFQPDLERRNFEIGGIYIFAATEDGVYRSINHSQQWQKINQGTTQSIPEGIAYTLLVLTDSTSELPQYSILIGTDQGIYRSTHHGGDWQLIETDLPEEIAIRSLSYFEDNQTGDNQPSDRWMFAGTMDGRVFRSHLRVDPQLQHWQPIEIGLKATEIRVLQLDQHQTLWAGTESGVFRSPQLGSDLNPIEWQRSNRGLTNSQILVLATDAQGRIWAGATEGIFQSDDQGRYWRPLLSWERINERLKTKSIQALLIKPEIDVNDSASLTSRATTQSFQPELIIVGTAEGIYLSSDRGDRWVAVAKEQGLIYPDVRSLALYPIDPFNTHLLAGTLNGGIFRSSDQGKTWVPTGLNNTDVQAIAVRPPVLFAGTVRHGIFRSTNGGLIWEQFTATRPGTGRLSSDGAVLSGSNTRFQVELQIGDTINIDDQTRTVVAIDSDTRLTVNTPFRPELFNAQFTINTGLSNRNVTTLAIGARFQRGNLTSNPNATNSTQQRQIWGDEHTKFTTWFKPGDTITLALDQPSSQTRTVTEVISDQLLTLDRPLEQRLSGNVEFTINLNLVFAGTDGSGVFRSRDNGDRWEAVNTQLDDLVIRCLTSDPRNGEIWVGTAHRGVYRSSNEGDLWQAVNIHLTNLDVRSILIPDAYGFDQPVQNPDQPALLIGGIGILQSPDRLYSRPMQRGEVVEIDTPPETVSDRSEEHQQWQVKNKDGFVGVLTTIDPPDLSFLPASEDSEPRSELAVIQQPPTDQQLPILTLNNPLKYSYDPATVNIYANVAQATHGETVEEVLGSGDGNEANQRFILKKPPLTYIPASNARGSASTLQVRVNGVLWQEVNSLYPLTPQDQSYIIRIEDDGTTTTQFGDGSKGARLPSGIENVIARYRSGIGLAGNMGAGRLSLLKTRPQGISKVVNPLPATGGAPPESLATARTKAPPTVRTLDRIVSLQDFEDFVQGFAGIGKAQAVALWSGDSQLVHITIAAVGGDVVDPISNLYTKLIAAIDNTRDPIQQVQVDSYERLLFNLEARLLIDPRYEAKEVENKVREALIQTFAFEKRAFGQSVTVAETIAAIQPIPGMIAVDLDALYQLGRSKALEQSLIASSARNLSQSNEIRPAQLLLLNQAGIELTIVTAL